MTGDPSAYVIGALITLSTLMRVNSRSPMHHELWPPLRRTILKSSERHCHLCVEYKSSTSICTDDSLFWFVLVTYHKPLTTLLGPKKRVPPLAALRLQRWAKVVTEIELKPTKEHEMLMAFPGYLYMVETTCSWISAYLSRIRVHHQTSASITSLQQSDWRWQQDKIPCWVRYTCMWGKDGHLDCLRSTNLTRIAGKNSPQKETAWCGGIV